MRVIRALSVLLVFALVAAAPTYAGTPEVGDEAPVFEFEVMGGDVQSLDDLKGNIVVMDFWATWCGPCKKAMPHLQEVHEKYADSGVVVLAISNEASDKVKGFLDANTNLQFLFGLNKTAVSDYGIQGIPHTYLLDPDGVVAWHGHPSGLDKPLEELVAKHPNCGMGTPKEAFDKAKKLLAKDATCYEGYQLLKKVVDKHGDDKAVGEKAKALLGEWETDKEKIEELEDSRMDYEAGKIYAKALKAFEDEEWDAFETEAGKIKNDYGSTSFAAKIEKLLKKAPKK